MWIALAISQRNSQPKTGCFVYIRFMKISDANKRYLEYLKLNNKLGAYKTYPSQLSLFEGYMRNSGINDTKLITEKSLNSFGEYLRKYAPNYKSYVLNILKGYMRFYIERGEVVNMHTSYIQTQAYKEVYKDTLTLSETKQILNVFDKENYIDLRNKLILHLLYDTACRVSEIMSLTLESLGDAQDCTAVIESKKTNQLRFIMWSKQTNDLLHIYLGYRLSLDVKTDSLFVVYKTPSKTLSVRQVQRMVQKAGELCGIDKQITPHTFRHTKAHHMIDKGAGLEIVRQKLGHKNIQNTTKYTRTNLQEFKNLQEMFL